MNCYYHPNVEAIATCTSCGRAICHTCAVDVAGKITCQNCVANGKSVQSNKPTNSLAVASIVLGVLGLCTLGVIFSIPAWILGNMAQKQLKENPNQEGMQLANVGRVLGMIITILSGSLILLYILFVFGTIIVSLLSSLIQQ